MKIADRLKDHQKYDQAERYYVSAVKYCKPLRHTYIYYSLGDCYEDRAKYDIALQYYSKALELEPDNVAVLSSMGRVYFRQGLLEKSLGMYSRACELKPDDRQLVNFRNLLKQELAKRRGYGW